MNLNMNLDFEFATAKQILFKTNGIMDIAKSILKLGKYPLVVTGKDKGRAKPLLDALSHASMNYVLYTIHGEPTTTDLIQGVEIAKDSKCDMVIGFGGGSVLDSAKAIAILMNNPGELMDYLEVIGKGLPMENPSAPLVLIPTTSGTGSEVTKNSVVTSQEEK
ncbi:Alcohol dehydrogenase (fragment) [Petrocella atlantisensis]|uniref:Alcohol dehydrogenase n=1 Tax=Petrocella atlantisensis TaxID=2173034 RepID=A0A3P7RSJ2_9FIRM